MKTNIFYGMIFILCLFTNKPILAQISEGGKPMSIILNVKAQEIPVIMMPYVDVEALIQEDIRITCSL